MSQLDERMRTRLRGLAERERSPLEAVDRQRIVARLGDLERAAPKGWVGLTIALAGFASIVGVVMFLRAGDAFLTLAPGPASPVTRTPEEERGLAAKNARPEASRIPRSSAETARRVEALAQVDDRRCSERPVPAVHRLVEGRREILEVGERARFVLIRDASAQLSEVADCRTTLVLDHGRVVVHARDLMDGELSVETPSGRLSVHGTVFDVRVNRTRSGFQVAVAEGKVAVTELTSERTEPRMVTAGTALAIDERGVVERRLSSRRSRSLMELVGAAPPSPDRSLAEETPAPSSTVVRRGEVREGMPFVHDPGAFTPKPPSR